MNALHRYAGTLRFFDHHRWLMRARRTRPIALREIRGARVWVRVIRRELAETRAQLRPRLVVNGPFAIDSCTRTILSREGGMDPHARNSKTGAYGGPQALPGAKMATAGADWADNIWTQIHWMVGYETERYGSPCAALAAWDRQGWY